MMINRRHRSLLCLTTTLAAGWVTPALAQDTPAVGVQTQQDTASKPAPDAASNAPRTGDDAGLDIIVTARRSEERLQDVPISITVFNQQQIDNRNVVSGNDLATYTPSLTANTRYGSENSSFAIRGFTQELRTTASVAVYFADVVSPRAGNSGLPAGDGVGPGGFFDLQNVQVLKGPQGTLFGRNTTGGALLLVPKKPTGEFEGYVEGTYGNYDQKRVQAVLNVPLGDQARGRIGIDRMKRDGYLKNISGIGPDRFGNIDYVAVRASLVVDLTPDLENYTIASYNNSDNNGPISKLTRCVPGFPFGTLACAQLARDAAAGQGFYTVDNGEASPRSLSRTWQVINTTTYRASDALTIKNIASYSQQRNIIRAELFGTRFIIPTTFGPIANTGALAGRQLTFANSTNAPNRLSNKQENFTEELQLQGESFGGKLNWQAGGYFEKSIPLAFIGSQSPLLLSCENAQSFRCTDVLGTLIGRPGLGSINFAIGRTTFRNAAAYAQGTYRLLDNLKLTGGIRYTWDKTNQVSQSVTYRFLTPNVPTGFCTLTGLRTSSPAACEIRLVQKSDAPTWLVGLDYNPIEDVLAYGKYSRGYRQGATNFGAPAGFNIFGPEKVDTYEVGLKTSFRGAISGTFNVAAFYNDFSDQQLAIGLISSTNAATPTQAIVNAGTSRIQGIEVDASISPFRGFTVDASYAYLDTKLKSLAVPTAVAPFDIFQFAAVAGSRLAQTPSHKVSATASYRLPLPDDVGAVSLAATYTYTSSILIVSAVGGTLPSTHLLNLNLNWRGIAGSPIDAQLFATNVTKEKYYVGVNDQSRTGFVSQPIAEPRIYGARLRYNF